MKIALLLFSTLFLIFTLGSCLTLNKIFNSTRAIPIVTLENGSFQLKLNDLKRIIEAGDIQNRKAVIISVAGAFRTGKCLLLRFFLRYLQAQVIY